MAKMATKKNRVAKKVNKSPTRGLSRPQRKAVLSLVRGQAETKRATFFQTASSGAPPPAIATGLYSGRGWALQNNEITSNVTDILQLIPYVTQGDNDFERIGQRIKPVSLTVKGALRITGTLIAGNSIGSPPTVTPQNYHVNLYVLQHVSLKTYSSLRANNDFTQLLQTGEGTTTGFIGEALSHALPVATQYYRVLARKTVVLKYAGNVFSAPGVGSVSNAHSWYANYEFNLSKHLPATLQYPEATFPLPNPQVDDAPTNSSIFMCMGYCTELNTNPPVGADANLEQTYVSSLLYKDM